MRMAVFAALAVAGGMGLARYAGGGAASGYAIDEQGTEYDYTPPNDETEQLTTAIDDMKISLSPSTYTPAAVNDQTASLNQRAFLEMLKFSEGVPLGLDGYRTLFGGTLFDNGFIDHPRIAKQFTDGAGRRLWTSAAGAYQFMAVSPIPTGGATRVNTWDTLQRRLQLPDFGPDSQDRAALDLVRERGALADVQAGRLALAIQKCAPVWASLPGAGYAQKERKINTLFAAYAENGGNLEA
jgi:muramidase (phage lysozyme)